LVYAKRNREISLLMDKIHRPIDRVKQPNHTVHILDIISEPFFSENPVVRVVLPDTLSEKMLDFFIDIGHQVVDMGFGFNFDLYTERTADSMPRFFDQ
jgi:hypothetical protein